MTINLDTTSKVLTVISLAIAVTAAWKALPLDEQLKELQAQTQQLDLKLKEAEAQLKRDESSRKLSFDLYQEVKKILEKKDRTPSDEDALKVLVESLADDPFRYKLLSVLSVSAANPGVKQSAKESSTFFQEQAELSLKQSEPSSQPALSKPAQGSIGSYDIDIFYCATKKSSSEPLAQKVLTLRQQKESGRWRSRLLPDSVNQQPGYGISSNEIRYNPPEELPVAKIIQQRLKDQGIESRLKETLQPTKWYLSVFVCQ